MIKEMIITALVTSFLSQFAWFSHHQTDAELIEQETLSLSVPAQTPIDTD